MLFFTIYLSFVPMLLYTLEIYENNFASPTMAWVISNKLYLVKSRGSKAKRVWVQSQSYHL